MPETYQVISNNPDIPDVNKPIEVTETITKKTTITVNQLKRQIEILQAQKQVIQNQIDKLQAQKQAIKTNLNLNIQ